jgi:hypothetical protein
MATKAQIIDKAKNLANVSVSIPPPHPKEGSLKTPADEGIEYFEGDVKGDEEPVRVYELRLEEDGGPNKDRAARSNLHRRFVTMADDWAYSTHVFHLRTFRTYYASLWMLARMLPRTECSGPTSRLMEGSLIGLNLWNGG